MIDKEIRILHLEDTAFDVELVSRELRKGGIKFETLAVENKVDFEKALNNYYPDIILSDHNLPSFDSLGALELSKRILPGIPFVLVTATVSEEFAVNILKEGATDYILKSNLGRLPSAVLSAIEKANMIREKESNLQELKSSYQQIRILASHLQNIREEERAMIAREIHDELGQQLTALKLDISLLMLKLSNADPEIIEKISSMEKLLSGILTTVKKIATELHPALLEKLGIIEAIKWQSKEFEKRSGKKIALTLPGEDLDIPNKTAMALFRIYQESLTNITRHSEARNVSCNFQQTNDQLVLNITDDGKGFEISGIDGKQSLGLLSMKERSVMIGGEYEIDSKPGLGTSITVRVPFKMGKESMV